MGPRSDYSGRKAGDNNEEHQFQMSKFFDEAPETQFSSGGNKTLVFFEAALWRRREKEGCTCWSTCLLRHLNNVCMLGLVSYQAEFFV